MSFIKNYVEYASEFTDSPKEFHEAMAYFCMSSILGSRCRLDIGQNGLFPVIWVALLAPSGFYRKSTALNIAQNVIMSADPLAVIGSQFNEKQVIDTLAEQKSACTFFGEFDRLLLNRRGTLISTLIEIFDCPPFLPVGRIRSNVDVSYPFLNIAAASTNQWFSGQIRNSDIQGGLIPRFLIIVPEDRAVKPLQEKHDADKFSKLINALTMLKLRADGSAYKYSAMAASEYSSWYASLVHKNTATGYRYDPFMVRLADYVHKIALLSFIDSGTEGLEIGPEFVKVGYRFCDAVFKRLADSEILKAVGKSKKRS